MNDSDIDEDEDTEDLSIDLCSSTNNAIGVRRRLDRVNSMRKEAQAKKGSDEELVKYAVKLSLPKFNGRIVDWPAWKKRGTSKATMTEKGKYVTIVHNQFFHLRLILNVTPVFISFPSTIDPEK